MKILRCLIKERGRSHRYLTACGGVIHLTERFFEIEAEKKSLIENKDGGNIFTSQYWWVVLVLSFVAGFGGGVFARRSIKLKTYE